MINGCKYPGCVAQANPGRDHCTVHYPENVAARAVDIVVKAFWPLVGRKQPWVPAPGGITQVRAFQAKMATIRDQIIEAIRSTI